MSKRGLDFPTPTCTKSDCPRSGQPLRPNTERRVVVKGSDGDTVSIHVFLCEQYGPQKTLHTHYTGPHGEPVERLNHHGSFRYQDSITGTVIETTCGVGPHRFSPEARRRLSDAITKRFWSDPVEKAHRVKSLLGNDWNFRKAWKDPEKRMLLEQANRVKSADPQYRERMSQAHLNLSPEKKRRKSEAVRAARLKERAIILKAKPKKPGRRLGRLSEDTDARVTVVANCMLRGMNVWNLAPYAYPRQYHRDAAFRAAQKFVSRNSSAISQRKDQLSGLPQSERDNLVETAVLAIS
jgi:hypothetical protein